MNVFLDIILPILIVILALIISIVIYLKLNNKFSKNFLSKPKENKTPMVKLKEHYCTEEEMNFLSALHKTLPREFIAFPHVGVSQLIEPKNNMVDFNAVSNQFLDICVFLRKNMVPVLAIDLYSQSPAEQQLKKFDDNVNKVLKEVKIPVIHKQIAPEYNKNELLVEILRSLDPVTVAYIKERAIEDIDRNKIDVVRK